MASQPPILCLLGPTAVGKSKLAMALATDYFDAQIIAVDAVTAYRQFNIGSGKPSDQDRAAIVHHCIDIASVYEPITVAYYANKVHQAIASVHAKGQLPILVGGSMMYFKVILQGLSPLPAFDTAKRQAMQSSLVGQDPLRLWATLRDADSRAAQRIHPHDTCRILRALDAITSTGKPLHHLQNNRIKSVSYDAIILGIVPACRRQLRQQIAQRIDHMIAQGMIEEAKVIYENPSFDCELSTMRSVGYRQIWPYFGEQYDQQEACKRIYHATCQLAKRQMTWLRSWEKIHFLPSDTCPDRLSNDILLASCQAYRKTHDP